MGQRPLRRVGFGALRVLGQNGFGPPASPATSAAVLAEAAARTDLIDTADCYGPALSEAMIAETLHPYRAGLMIATKGGMTCDRPGEWRPTAEPERLLRSSLESMVRLRLDCIDLYQLHAVDPAVDFERSVEALAQLHAEGLIRDVGLCNVTIDQLHQAQRIVPIASVQNRFNVLDTGDDGLLDECSRQGIAFLPWFPLQRGVLADNQPVLWPVARKHGATAAQIALAWLLTRSPVMLPIPGTSTLPHLLENCAAADIVLDEDDMHLLGQHRTVDLNTETS